MTLSRTSCIDIHRQPQRAARAKPAARRNSDTHSLRSRAPRVMWATVQFLPSGAAPTRPGRYIGIGPPPPALHQTPGLGPAPGTRRLCRTREAHTTALGHVHVSAPEGQFRGKMCVSPSVLDGWYPRTAEPEAAYVRLPAACRSALPEDAGETIDLVSYSGNSG